MAALDSKHLKPFQAEDKDFDGKVVTPRDSSTITALKAIICPIFNEKFKLQDIHILATVLDPIMKNKLPGMTFDGSQFNHATESLRAKTMSLQIDERASNGGHSAEQPGDAGARCIVGPAVSAPPAKRQRVLNETMSIYDACISNEEKAIDNLDNNGQLDILTIRIGREHAAYLDYTVSETEMKKVVSAVKKKLPKSRKHTADFQVLMWWKLFGTYLIPMIARVARSTRCVSASSAKSENNYSDAGNALTKRRSNPCPHTVSDMMFMQSNYDICCCKEV